MAIRAAVFQRMAECGLSAADLVRLLAGRVRERTVYDFLTGYNAYRKAAEVWMSGQPHWEHKPRVEPMVANWQVANASDGLRGRVYEEHAREHNAWRLARTAYDAAFNEHQKALAAWTEIRPQPEAFFRNAAPMGADNLDHLLDALGLLVTPELPPSEPVVVVKAKQGVTGIIEWKEWFIAVARLEREHGESIRLAELSKRQAECDGCLKAGKLRISGWMTVPLASATPDQRRQAERYRSGEI